MTDDPVVSLVALDAVSKKLASKALSPHRWQSAMTKDDLTGRLWLISYEANVKGWLPSVSGGDHVSGHPIFRHLKAAGVHFYDDQASLTYLPRKPVTKAVEGAPPVAPPPEEVY